MNSDTPTIDEQPKKAIAAQVITNKSRTVVVKRHYFLPHLGITVKARTPQEAVDSVNQPSKEKVGDE